MVCSLLAVQQVTWRGSNRQPVVPRAGPEARAGQGSQAGNYQWQLALSGNLDAEAMEMVLRLVLTRGYFDWASP